MDVDILVGTDLHLLVPHLLTQKSRALIRVKAVSITDLDSLVCSGRSFQSGGAHFHLVFNLDFGTTIRASPAELTEFKKAEYKPHF